MLRSTRSSSASDNSRPELRAVAWRPSRWVVAALSLLAALAPFAVLASDMPRVAAWPFAGIAAAAGVRAAMREARKPPKRLVLESGTGRASLDGVALAGAALAWRGPLAFLRWRDADGRHGLLSWWPDTLPPAERRVLRLWSPDPRGMAP